MTLRFGVRLINPKIRPLVCGIAMRPKVKEWKQLHWMHPSHCNSIHRSWPVQILYSALSPHSNCIGPLCTSQGGWAFHSRKTSLCHVPYHWGSHIWWQLNSMRTATDGSCAISAVTYYSSCRHAVNRNLCRIEVQSKVRLYFSNVQNTRPFLADYSFRGDEAYHLQLHIECVNSIYGHSRSCNTFQYPPDIQDRRFGWVWTRHTRDSDFPNSTPDQSDTYQTYPLLVAISMDTCIQDAMTHHSRAV